jgi:hypothetical protein
MASPAIQPIFKGGRVSPSKATGRLACIANEFINLGRSEITRVYSHQIFSTVRSKAHFIGTLSSPNDPATDLTKGKFDKFSN